jgi:hypothetical protein
MAYGLTSNSFLLSVGARPAAASGAVHVAEIFTTAAPGASHIRFKNVDKALLIKICFLGLSVEYWVCFLSPLSTVNFKTYCCPISSINGNHDSFESP